MGKFQDQIIKYGPLVVFIIIVVCVIYYFLTKGEGYYSPLYTGINLNKAFAVRSAEVTVDLGKATELVEEKISAEQVSLTDVNLYKNPIIINEEDRVPTSNVQPAPLGLHREPYMLWHVPETKEPIEKPSTTLQNIYIDYFSMQSHLPNPFAKVPLQENFGVSPFSMTPRFGITPNFCCLGPNGKACSSKDCKECNNCWEQDEPLGGGIKTRPSQNLYAL